MSPPEPTKFAEHAPLLAGRYAHGGELGRGSTGRVLRVSDRRDPSRALAVKVVDATASARLEAESEALRRIAHPNVARVFELLYVDKALSAPFSLPAGSVVLVEELAEGLTSDRKRLEVQDPVAWTLQVGAAVAAALSAVHRVGLVHGDVKPSNIVVGPDPAAAKLIDLGLAAMPHAARLVAGTPAFLAPEALQGERSVATDLYALGATLHALFGGTVAWAERTLEPAQWVREALAHPRSTATLPGAVPPSARRLLDALLAAEPADRPLSARAVQIRLLSILDDLGVRAARPPVLAQDLSSEESALILSALPLVGRDETVRELVQALGHADLVVVSGPPGAGKTRVIQEAVGQIQRESSRAGRSAGTYLRELDGLPQLALSADSIVHVTEGDETSVAEGLAFLRASAISGHSHKVILERAESVDAEATVFVGPFGREQMRLLLLRCAQGLASEGRSVSDALLDAAMEASGGLPGQLCRAFARILLDSGDIFEPEDVLKAAQRTVSSSSGGFADEDIVQILSVAGGRLPESTLRRFAHAPSACARLARVGLLTLDEEVRLRPDVVASVRAGIAASEREKWARRLLAEKVPDVIEAFACVMAGDPVRAEAAFLRASRKARNAGRPESAARLLERGVREIPDREALRTDLADALRACGRYADALAALVPVRRALAQRAELERLRGSDEDAKAEAGRVVVESHEAVERWAAQGVLARLALQAGDFDGAHALAEALAAALALRARPHDALAWRAVELRALIALARQEPAAATRDCQVARDEAHAAGDRASEARLESVLGTLGQRRGLLSEALASFTRARVLAHEAGELHLVATCTVNVGLIALDGGDLGRAADALREGGSKLARLGRESDLARALYNLGLAWMLVGDDDLARSALRRATESAERASDSSVRCLAAVLQSDLLLREGDLQEARRWIEAACEQTAPPRDQAVAHGHRAILCASLGDRAGAERSLGILRATAAENSGAQAWVERWVAEGRVQIALGTIDDAASAAVEARLAAEREGSFESLLRSALLSAEVAERRGDRAEADGFFARARGLLETASASLPVSARTRMRQVRAYQRAFSVAAMAQPIATDGKYRDLVRVSKRLTAERRIVRVREEILYAALEQTGAERALIVARLIDGTWRVLASRGQGAVAGIETGFSTSVAARALDTGVPVTTVDAASDESLSAAQSVHSLALRSVLAIHLPCRLGAPPVLYVDDRLRPGAFGKEQVDRLADLAELAAIALDGVGTLRALRREVRRSAVLRRKLSKTVQGQSIELSSLRRLAQEGSQLVSTSGPMRAAVELAGRLSTADISVLITGESGVGKELLAHTIHDRSPRKGSRFVAENCAAIPPTLVESVLFGHARGAFTGATESRIGLFEAADGGTLFLDEIADLSPQLQAKLLRVLETGEIRPVGSDESREVNVRIVSATRHDLAARIREGVFREDLYYRLAAAVLHVPALRERKADLPELAKILLRKHGAGPEARIAADAMRVLTSYAWPGNVRELENEMQRALALSGGAVALEHLSDAVRGRAALPPGSGDLDLKAAVSHLEADLIARALEQAGGNQTQAAKLLGLSRFGLQKMMKRLSATNPSPRGGQAR